MADKGGKASVAVMTRNEEDTVAAVVSAVMPHADETLVVDGHSTDRKIGRASCRERV